MKKVAGKGAGAGMLRDIPKMLEITRAVVDAVRLPVTVKTRLGWDHEHKVIVELAEQLQDCGIKALTVHGRTRSQMYTGEADWEMIARVKENPRLTIPVIGNGDITTPEKLVEAFCRYGVDGVMVGRAAIGNPWVFHDMKQTLLQSRGILHIRRHLAVSQLFKGLPSFRPTRIAMLRASTKDELFGIIDQVESRLKAGWDVGVPDEE